MAGHPFKGSWVSSSGYLLHPEMKRFQINTPILFAPPNPLKTVGATAAVGATVPTFNNFFSAYFVGSSYTSENSACGKVFSGLRKCFETNAATNPHVACQYYLDAFKRFNCTK